MIKKEKIIGMLEESGLDDIEVIKEEEGMALVRFWYRFDEDELSAAENFAQSEEELDESEEESDEDPAEDLEDEGLDEDGDELLYDEDDEYYDDPALKYLAEIAIDHAGEVLEELRDDLDLEVQYVGYDPTEENYAAYEFVTLIFDKNQPLNIEDILDELDM